MKMMIKKIIKWNIAFILLYLTSSTFIYLISNETPETIPVIILTCLIFNGIITIAIMHKNLRKSIIKTYIKQEGGEKNHEKTNADKAITTAEPIDDICSTDNIY
jgi:hypothetical protein